MSYEKIDPIALLREQHMNYSRVGITKVTRPVPLRVAPPPQPSTTFVDVLLGLAKIAAAGAAVYVGYKIVDELTMPKRRRHDREVKRAAHEEVSKGRAVAADIKGWPKPPVIGGHRPDVFSIDDDGTQTAIEVEHPSTVLESHAISQVTTFDRWATRSKKRESILRLT